MIAVCNALFPFDDSSFHSGDICDQFTIFGNFDVLGRQILGAKGPVKFLTEYYKFRSPVNMLQSLVMIDRATSEISRQKRKKKENKNRNWV